MGVQPSIYGKYTPLGRLGSGGMADIFLALARGPERVQRLVVLKRLRQPRDRELTQMFLDEARLSVRLNHPNIVHAYEVGQEDGEYFIAMEYLEGQSLCDVLEALTDRSQDLPETCALGIAIEILKGLHYAHEFCDFDGTPLGVVHRDMSPHNMFITYAGDVKILDFGIAKARLNETQTETGTLKGKVRYMSPEQATQRPIDRRSDVFAVGIVTWEMLARQPLFSGDAIAVLSQLANRELPRASTLRPQLSAEIDAVVHKALQRGVDDRYATAEDMRHDLERALRRTGDHDTKVELSRLMNSLFASKRDTLRAQIRERLAEGRSVEGGGGSAISAAATRRFDEPPSTLVAPELSPTPMIASRSPPESEDAPSKRRLALGVGVGLAIAATLGAIVGRPRDREFAAAPAAKPALSYPSTAPGDAGPPKVVAASDRPEATPLAADMTPAGERARVGAPAVATTQPTRTRATSAPTARPTGAPAPPAPSASTPSELQVQMIDEDGDR